MSEDIQKVEQAEQNADEKQQAELPAEDLDKVSGGAFDAFLNFKPKP